ncbi:MAG: hypothetical protein R3B70_44155 [Polyangiaceae bacterium]
MDDTDKESIETEPGPEKKKGSDTLVVVLMLIALACVGITAAIAFHDMSAAP